MSRVLKVVLDSDIKEKALFLANGIIDNIYDRAYVCYDKGTDLEVFSENISEYLRNLYSRLREHDIRVYRPVIVGATSVSQEEQLNLINEMNDIGLIVIPQDYDYYIKHIWS